MVNPIELALALFLSFRPDAAVSVLPIGFDLSK
jgi:hypothetical protein